MYKEILVRILIKNLILLDGKILGCIILQVSSLFSVYIIQLQTFVEVNMSFYWPVK